jgi:hypothetical protein
MLGAMFACMGVLSGQGRPIPAAVAYLCGAFLLSPSIGALLAFVVPQHCPWDCAGSPLVGLWWGYGLGYVVTTAILCIAVWRSDWTVLAAEAQKRSEVLVINAQSGRSPPLEGIGGMVGSGSDGGLDHHHTCGHAHGNGDDGPGPVPVVAERPEACGRAGLAADTPQLVSMRTPLIDAAT